MKTKYSSNRELIHIWANNSDSSVYKSANSVSCQFDRLFSYNTCIAEIVKDTVIFNTYSYSNTTSKHQSLARQAIHGLKAIHLEIPRYNLQRLALTQNDFDEIIAKPNMANVGHLLVKADRARLNSDSLKADAVSIVDNLKAYAELLNLEFSAPDLTAYQEAALRADKAAKAEAKIRKAEKIRDQAEKLEQWRNGEDVRAHFEVTALRVKGDEIETTKGARIPVDHAIRAWPLLKRIHDKGEAVSLSHSIKLGHYTVNNITSNALIVGCHTIPFSEVENIANQLHI